MGRDLKVLGENITLLRKRLCLKQDQLAEIVGTSQSQINALESKKTCNPGYFIVEALADFFGVNNWDLVHKRLVNLSPKEQLINRVRTNTSDSDFLQIKHLVDGQHLEYAKSGKFRYEYRQIKKSN